MRTQTTRIIGVSGVLCIGVLMGSAAAADKPAEPGRRGGRGVGGTLVHFRAARATGFEARPARCRVRTSKRRHGGHGAAKPVPQ